MRVLASVSLLILVCTLISCGGSSAAPQNSGPLTGNWQLNLVQNFPTPQTTLSAAGFLVQSTNGLTGSVQGPAVVSSNGSGECGGVGPLTGTISGQSVTFSLNPGATVFNFTGVISTDNQSMSGSYQALGGACFGNPTSGTWTASLVPPLTGNFTGTLTGSNYMSVLTGVTPPAPINVSGSLTQSSNAGASNATLTGTITAVGYPCFTTAYLTGTINGQNVYLNVFDYSGVQIGTLGVAGVVGSFLGTPAVVTSGSTGISLAGTGQGGLSLGNAGVPPCPPIAQSSGSNLTGDTTTITLTLQ